MDTDRPPPGWRIGIWGEGSGCSMGNGTAPRRGLCAKRGGLAFRPKAATACSHWAAAGEEETARERPTLATGRRGGGGKNM